MFKRAHLILILIFAALMPTKLYAVAVNDTMSGSSPICNASATLNANEDEVCRATPITYKVKIYEMGLCTASPYGAAKTANLFDTASCVVTYTDAAPVEVDIAATVGGTVQLNGTSTPPPDGSYTHAYMLMSKDFKVSGSIVNGAGATYYSKGTGNAPSTVAPAVEQTDSLVNFDPTTECVSGYLGATVPGGTLDGFITDLNKERGVSADKSGAGNSVVCTTHVGYVTGVMNLTAPINVTPNTFSVAFNFLVTDAGVLWGDDNNSTKDQPDQFNNGPFMGYFTVLSAD